jgi:hypothetical protein
MLDSTAEQIAVIEQNSALAEQLSQLFQRAGGEVLYAMCMPVFRDALVFYDAQGQLLRVLHICFECLYMEASDKLNVEADAVFYSQLRKLLIQLGHPIE